MADIPRVRISRLSSDGFGLLLTGKPFAGGSGELIFAGTANKGRKRSIDLIFQHVSFLNKYIYCMIYPLTQLLTTSLSLINTSYVLVGSTGLRKQVIFSGEVELQLISWIVSKYRLSRVNEAHPSPSMRIRFYNSLRYSTKELLITSVIV